MLIFLVFSNLDLKKERETKYRRLDTIENARTGNEEKSRQPGGRSQTVGSKAKDQKKSD